MRKIILYIAQTLDGYIADLNDGFSFLHEYDSVESIQTSYQALTKRIDTVIMGRKTYDVINQMGNYPYSDFKSYIVTSKTLNQSNEKIEFVDDVVKLVKKLKETEGKDVWLVGGGILIETFMKHSLIDEYMIAIIPKLIGQGKRLFNPINHYEKLKLLNIGKMQEIVMLTYGKIGQQNEL